MQSLFRVCIGITIFMVIFTLSVSFVNDLGVLPAIAEGVGVGDNSSDTLAGMTEQSEYPGGLSMGTIWSIVLTGAGIGALVVAWMTHSTTVIGVLIFSIGFWASYVNCIGILNIGGYIPEGFIMIGSTAMLFVWIGAIAGMLSGSG